MPIGWTGGVYCLCVHSKKYSWQSILQRKYQWDDGLDGACVYSPDAACCWCLVHRTFQLNLEGRLTWLYGAGSNLSGGKCNKQLENSPPSSEDLLNWSH